MNVLIVESAAKSRTLQKYLGSGWSVVATGGHVQTLPYVWKKHGKDASKAYWANRPGALPSPPWVWTDRGEDAVDKILEAAGADGAEFWIATDPDREGEFIAWCLDRLLSERGPTHRVAFQEVTREAVEAAIEHPRPVDRRLVESALVRKFLDRLVGYRTSKLAKSLVPGRSASMGRVQTPTLGFVVERELEREAHEPIPYFEVRAVARGVDLEVRFHERDDEAAWRDEAGKVHPSRTFDGDLAETASTALARAGAIAVTGATTRTRQRRPDAPFSTDALLQAAGSRFGWSPRKTSALASMLYEAGHITYIRTDSTRLAESAVRAARAVVASSYGDDHLGPGVTGTAAKGPVQDAHEAIRPTRLELEEPELDDHDARRLYRLVRAQTLASQMAPSQRTTVSLGAAADGLDRPLTGTVSWRTFDGWEAAFAEFMGDIATSPPSGLQLEEGAVWTLDPGTEEKANPLLIEDATKPPPRYRQHTLIKAMKEAGIGRPSTYSRTVERLEERDYVRLEDGALVPTDHGRIIWTQAAPLYAREEGEGTGPAEELFSPEFTAEMEERLDRIATGEVPAPASWEEWRDDIRNLHELAQAKKKAGRIVPSQRKLLHRLLANAPAEVRARHGDLSRLSWEEANGLIRDLKDGGVEAAPTDKQMDLIRELITNLGLEPDELQELIGGRSVEEMKTSLHASAAIEELRRLYEERRPPSAKQLRLIRDLATKAGLTEAEAAPLVGASSFDELTGGRDGTASVLIDLLNDRLGGM